MEQPDVFDAYLDCHSARWAPEPAVWDSETGWGSAVLFLRWDRADDHGRVAVFLWPWVCEPFNYPNTRDGTIALSRIFDDVLIDEVIVVLCKCMRGSDCAITDKDVTHAHRKHRINS
jgi:hypothetical protein